jgi:hypothetical protein
MKKQIVLAGVIAGVLATVLLVGVLNVAQAQVPPVAAGPGETVVREERRDGV